MSEELNSLLEKIHARGVKKIEAERCNMINTAKQEALSITSTAHEEAAKIRLAVQLSFTRNRAFGINLSCPTF